MEYIVTKPSRMFATCHHYDKSTKIRIVKLHKESSVFRITSCDLCHRQLSCEVE